MSDLTMSDPAIDLPRPASTVRRIAAAMRRSLRRSLTARRTREALSDLPDDLLRDVGLSRCDITFVANSLAAEQQDPSREAHGVLNKSVAKRGVLLRMASR